EIRGQVSGRFDLDHERQIAAPDGGQQFLAGLNRTFRPAMLLGFETIHVYREFRGRDHVRKENEFPAGELSPVTEVEILGERVVLPAARFIDARASPETGGAIEIEKPAAPAARGLLEQQMPVEEHGLDPREQRVTAIQMTPPRLDHSDLGVGEEMDRALQQIGLGHEVSVEDTDVFALGGGEPDLESASLETGPVRAVDLLDVNAAALQVCPAGCGQFSRI